MKRSMTNRFVTNSLRTLCCIGTLTACSAWASIASWQFNPTSTGAAIGATQGLTGSGQSVAAQIVDNVSSDGSTNQLLFKSAPENGGVAEANELLAGGVNKKVPAEEIDTRLESARSQSGGQISNESAQPDESLFASSNAEVQAPPAAPQPNAALDSAFDEEFVSVPTVEFTSVAAGPKDVSVNPSAAVISAVPEMSALFPIIGLIAAVACTHILRRRRAAQNATPIA